MKLAKIASLVSGTLKGEGSFEITGVCGVHDAQEGDITFFMQNKYLDALKNLVSKKIELETLLNITNK